MTSLELRKKRFGILDRLGLTEIAERYMQANSVGELMGTLFEPERNGSRAGAVHFYRWLDVRGLRAEWDRWVEIKQEVLADEQAHGILDRPISAARTS